MRDTTYRPSRACYHDFSFTCFSPCELAHDEKNSHQASKHILMHFQTRNHKSIKYYYTIKPQLGARTHITLTTHLHARGQSAHVIHSLFTSHWKTVKKFKTSSNIRHSHTHMHAHLTLRQQQHWISKQLITLKRLLPETNAQNSFKATSQTRAFKPSRTYLDPHKIETAETPRRWRSTNSLHNLNN